MNASIRLTLAAALAAIIALPGVASAQSSFHSAGGKITGEAYWPSVASSRRLHSARNYAQDFQQYLATNPKPAPEVVKEVTAGIGKDLAEAKLHLASMKKSFAADKEAMAAIEKLEKGLATAFEHHKMLGDCCAKETFDKIATMSCCKDLAKELDQIVADHTALMTRLAGKPTAPAATPAKKK